MACATAHGLEEIMILGQLSEQVSETLTPLASWFSTFNMPEPVIHWGHPLMMGIVIFVVGSYVADQGWKIRAKKDGDQEALVKYKQAHRTMAPLMFAFLAMGYTGGVLSMVMQEQSLFASPHFWTGTSVLALLGLNGAISAVGFGQDKGTARTIHAYLGTAALLVMVVHAAFGLKLGLSI